MSNYKANFERRDLLKAATAIFGFIVATPLLAKGLLSTKAQGDVVLGDAGTWPQMLLGSARALSDYGHPIRFPITMQKLIEVKTSIDQVFWIELEAATDKAKAFGEPMYKFSLYNSDASRVIDYMYTSATNTVTFYSQNIQFGLVPP